MENCKLNEQELPDDILLNIFSRLNIKEQASTSILSSRWTNLWTFDTRCLTINAADFIQSETDRQLKTLKFIDKVDQILKKHRGQVIDELKIIYPTTAPCVIPGKVDSWIDIAKQKQVKDLYLDFKFFEWACKDHVPMFSSSTTFSSLLKLYLKQAYLSVNIIHGLLSNAPNLLELSIIRCNTLLTNHVNISGPSLKLKHLALIDNHIYFLEISAPNLVSFSFSTVFDAMWPRRIYFDNIPLLTQLSCHQWLTLRCWKDLYALFPQLVTLILTHTHITTEDSGIPNDFPVLTNLENLHVRLSSDKDNGRLLALLRASPSLCRLSLDLGTDKQKDNNCLENFPDHKFLKEIEIDNFRELDEKMQLPICIARSCSSLDKIIIHPNSDKRDYYRKAKHVESVVKELAASLPQKKLEIVFKART